MLSAVAATTLSWQAGATSSLVAGPVAGTVAGRSPLRAAVRALVDDKAEVEEYFNNVGFERWNKIYSEDGEVNKVQLDIRTGHGITVEKVLGWVDQDGTAKAGETFCDAGCGVGSLAIPLATRGATVIASDISEAMQTEAAQRAAAAGVAERTTFSTSDLENLSGKYDTVTCIDVMIHYPPEKMAEMVKHLGSVADKRLIISFAPDTWQRSRSTCAGAQAAAQAVAVACGQRLTSPARRWSPPPFQLRLCSCCRYYRGLKAFGGLFPGPSKTTRAYLHPEENVVNALLVRTLHCTCTAPALHCLCAACVLPVCCLCTARALRVRARMLHVCTACALHLRVALGYRVRPLSPLHRRRASSWSVRR
jgi:magnesium-protoporphyrin O-methyltransferase